MLHQERNLVTGELERLESSRLFPSNIKIKDFGYPEHLTYRHGGNLSSYTYDGILVLGIEYDSDDELPILKSGDNEGHISESDGEDDEDYDEEYNYSRVIPDEINRKAIALFDFNPENDNEVPLVAGQIIWISYRHGQGWLVAKDPQTGENGLVPEEYVEIYYGNNKIFKDFSKNYNNDNDIYNDNDHNFDRISRDDLPKPFLPQILQMRNDHDWVDTDLDEDFNEPDNVDTVTSSVDKVKLSNDDKNV